MTDEMSEAKEAVKDLREIMGPVMEMVYAKLEDPRLAKAIAKFCENLDGELCPYGFIEEERLRIITAALSSLQGGK